MAPGEKRVCRRSLALPAVRRKAARNRSVSGLR